MAITDQHIQFAQIEPTTRCDLSCIFCAGRYLHQGDIEFRQFTSIIEHLPQLEYLELQGEGEPLLHPAFYEMVRYARFRGIQVSTISNGNSLRKETAEQLIDSGLETIFFSIDTVRPDMYSYLRGGELQQVLENIRYLSERKQQRNSESPAIGLAITILNDTVQDLEEILLLYSDFGLDGGFIFQPLQKMESYVKHYPRPLLQQIPDRKSLSLIEQKLNSHPLIKSILKNGKSHRNFYMHLFGDFDLKQFGCPWLTRGIYISYKGFVLPCCKVKDTKRYSLGRMGVGEFETILKKRILQNGELINRRIPASCTGCTTAEKIAGFTAESSS